MRISDWSSDVCSSDLLPGLGRLEAGRVIGEQPHRIGDLPQRAEFGRQARPVLPRAAEGGKQRVVVGRQVVPVETQRRIEDQAAVGDADFVTREQTRAGEVGARESAGRKDFAEGRDGAVAQAPRSEEHTSELQTLMRKSYAVFC